MSSLPYLWPINPHSELPQSSMAVSLQEIAECQPANRIERGQAREGKVRKSDSPYGILQFTKPLWTHFMFGEMEHVLQLCTPLIMTIHDTIYLSTFPIVDKRFNVSYFLHEGLSTTFTWRFDFVCYNLDNLECLTMQNSQTFRGNDRG